MYFQCSETAQENPNLVNCDHMKLHLNIPNQLGIFLSMIHFIPEDTFFVQNWCAIHHRQ